MDSVQTYMLFSHTECLAKRYERAVREGKELLAAVEYCRYLVNSGICDLLEQNASRAVIKIDAGSLKQFQWSCSVNKPHIDLSEVEGIHRKVDAMAQWMQKHDGDVIIGVASELIKERKVIEVDFSKVV